MLAPTWAFISLNLTPALLPPLISTLVSFLIPVISCWHCDRYDITSSGDIEFYEFVEMFCHGVALCVPMPAELKHSVRVLAAEGV